MSNKCLLVGSALAIKENRITIFGVFGKNNFIDRVASQTLPKTLDKVLQTG
jgi:hypothetical protein